MMGILEVDGVERNNSSVLDINILVSSSASICLVFNLNFFTDGFLGLITLLSRSSMTKSCSILGSFSSLVKVRLLVIEVHP